MMNEEQSSSEQFEQLFEYLQYEQSHLFEGVSDPVNDRACRDLIDQLARLDETTAGGLRAYLARAKKLLADSKAGVAPLAGCRVDVPRGVNLNPESIDYLRYEETGLNEVSRLCFVLVAGGLGERLGFPGIKIALPVETITGKCYMNWYCEYILALERLATESGSTLPEGFLPLAIMTSDDTHEKTLQLLESNNYFGLNPEQVTLMKQQKVPALSDSDGKIAVSAIDRFKVEAKPHGHGDVHSLLLQHGLVEKWQIEGRGWVFFFQDTNALAFRALVAVLGVSVERNFDMNTIAIPRLPGEATGGLCQIVREQEESVTCSVEYNVLGPLLAAQGGDTAESSGLSPFPGNSNSLLLKLSPYLETLSATSGVVPEFVNPKYADSLRNSFKSATRLECLMQDIALLLKGREVGFTMLPKWACFSVVKNSAAEASTKLKAGLPADCALSGEIEFFASNFRWLNIAQGLAGVEGADSSEEEEGGLVNKIVYENVFDFLGVSQICGPRVSLAPNFFPTLTELRRKIAHVRFGSDSPVLVVEGANASLLNVRVISGALWVKGTAVEGVRVKNEGISMMALSGEEGTSAERIRGFRTERLGVEFK